MVKKRSNESSDDLDRISPNGYSNFGYALGLGSMAVLGLRWVVDIPSRLELAALVLLVVAAIIVVVGVVVGAVRSGLSNDCMLALLQAGEQLDDSHWIDRFERPLQGLVERLWTRGHADAAVELLTKAVTTDFGGHHIDLAVAAEEALGLVGDELGLEGPNARTSVLRTLLEQARESSAMSGE